MANDNETWVPRPHPEALLYVEQRRRGKRQLVGYRGRTTVVMREDGTYSQRNADGSYSTGRWTQ